MLLTVTYEDPERGTMEILLDDADAVHAVHVVREKVSELDGVSRTLLTIGGEGDRHLAVGGDTRAGLVVYATYDNETFHNLVNSAGDRQQVVRVVAGGQPGQYPERHVVSLQAALRAATVFASDGRLADDLEWESA